MLQRRFPTIHNTDAEYTVWKYRAVNEIRKTLELNDNITTHKALNELVRRKGLNSYTKWNVLCRLRDERAKGLV
jgi:hypothetical protein